MHKRDLDQAKVEHNVQFINSSKNKWSAAWKFIKQETIAKSPIIPTVSPGEFNDCIKEIVNIIKEEIALLA